MIANTRLDYMKKEEQDAAVTTSRTGKAGNAEAKQRLLKLWSPFDSRLILNGVRIASADGKSVTVATDPVQKADALRQGWLPTFSQRPIDEDKARRVLDAYAKPIEFAGAPLPSLHG